MRRVWAGIVTVWVFLSLVAVLAWTMSRPPRLRERLQTCSSSKDTARPPDRVALAPAPAAIHATTQTSPPPP